MTDTIDEEIQYKCHINKVWVNIITTATNLVADLYTTIKQRLQNGESIDSHLTALKNLSALIHQHSWTENLEEEEQITAEWWEQNWSGPKKSNNVYPDQSLYHQYCAYLSLE